MRFHWDWLQARLETFNARAVEKKSDEGLTLIEMLGVVVILGIVAAIAIPSITSAITQAKLNTTKSDLGTLQTALSRYYLDEGQYPVNLTNLLTTASVTVTGGIPNPPSSTAALTAREKRLWNGPYLRHAFPEHDAWGHTIYYAPLDGSAGSDYQGYVLVSGDGTGLKVGQGGTMTAPSTTVIVAAGGNYSTGQYIGIRPTQLSSTTPLGNSTTDLSTIAGNHTQVTFSND